MTRNIIWAVYDKRGKVADIYYEKGYSLRKWKKKWEDHIENTVNFLCHTIQKSEIVPVQRQGTGMLQGYIGKDGYFHVITKKK